MNTSAKARAQQAAPKQGTAPSVQDLGEPDQPLETDQPAETGQEPPVEPVGGDQQPVYPIDVESVDVAERAHHNGFNVQKLRELIPGTNQYRVFYRIHKKGQ